MKKRILIVSIIFIILATAYIGYIIFKDKQISDNSNVSIQASEDIIKNPDRIIFKIESNYYEITKDDEKYTELVQLCRENFKETNEYYISEENIDVLKSEKNFIEFDYDTISKNNIFFLSGDAGVVKMNVSDGRVISKELRNPDKLLKKFEETIIDKEAYRFENFTLTATNKYSYLPATLDFKEIKYEKVYKREFTSVESYQEIIRRYHLEFEDIDIDELLKENKVILFLTKYDISEYKVNIGNIKIKFKGTDHIVPVSEEYIPILMIVSKIVNTDCIYYNYDQVETIDNLTGMTEELSGVIKSKNEDGTFNLGYTLDTDIVIGILKISDLSQIEGTDDLKIGDFVQVTGVIDSLDNNVKTYETKQLYVHEKAEYEKCLNDMLKGITKLDTDIIDYYESESGYDGYVICSLYFGENSYMPDGYVKIYYDFYEGNTESYLGMGRHLESNYGIVKYEIVTITFNEPVNDINNIRAKMFEYIAD